MSGNICAATNSPLPCSKATTTSSTNPAPRGASSPTTPNASPQSHPEPGRRSFLEAVGIIPAALKRTYASADQAFDRLEFLGTPSGRLQRGDLIVLAAEFGFVRS